MKTIYPEYFKQFTCIAGDCPDTCCAGWEVVVDKKFEDIYRSSTTPAAKKAVEKMYTDKDGDVCLALSNGRCPMLNKHNLCEIYIDMGKDALCDVCRIYPRFFKDTPNYTLAGLSLSCPETAKIILNDKSPKEIPPHQFLKNDKIFFDIFNTMCSVVNEGKFFCCDFDLLCEAYDDFIFNEYDFDCDTIKNCFTKSSSVRKNTIIKNNLVPIMNLEPLTKKWPEFCIELKRELETAQSDVTRAKEREREFLNVANTNEIKNLVIYFLYKYLWELIDDNNIELWIKRAYAIAELVCEMAICNCINSQLNIIEIARLASKEIEHSEDNLYAFEEIVL